LPQLKKKKKNAKLYLANLTCGGRGGKDERSRGAREQGGSDVRIKKKDGYKPGPLFLEMGPRGGGHRRDSKEKTRNWGAERNAVKWKKRNARNVIFIGGIEAGTGRESETTFRTNPYGLGANT